jgi:hypothetical protein
MVGEAARRRWTFRYLRDATLQKNNPRARTGMSKAELRQMAEAAAKTVKIKRSERRRRAWP